MLPEKKWFTLDEVAERWGVKKDLVEHYLLAENLTASLTLPVIFNDKGVLIGEHDILDYQSFCNSLIDPEFGGVTFMHEKNILGITVKLSEINNYLPAKITTDDVIIMSKNLIQFEEQHGIEPTKQLDQADVHNIETPSYLNPDHKHYSEELAAAIMAWKYAVEMNPPKNNFKSVIEKFLKANKSKLSKDAKSRIAMIANPHKNCGPRSIKICL